MTIIPPYLKPGDTIGLVCPAGFMPQEDFSTSIEILQQWGFKVAVGKTPGKQFNYFSGTDEERLNDLQKMMDNRYIKAILCARGGYGTGRIIDKLNFKKFVQHPKWIIGFSDITVLHSHLFSNYKIASMHAPMSAAFNEEEYKNEYIQSLQNALIGIRANYKVAPHEFNQKGKETGTLVGGNLSLLVNMIGTPSDIKTRNKILFMEDVGEYIYNVDRMVRHLQRSGKLEDLKGLIIGGFTDMKDTKVPYGQNAEEVIKDIVKDYKFPVAFHFPVSHDKENYALKVGVKYKFSVSDKEVSLKEA